MEKLRADNYAPYLTTVGGSGLGIFSPYHAGNYENPLTPPEGETAVVRESLRAAFETKDRIQLSEWADKSGHWLYV